ncbi:MAG TPA: NUDIX hydrolase [Thermoanaerobaculia bacterium]|nr:NUDIX hydrolase [Thermoanaerobaculia bacterium]
MIGDRSRSLLVELAHHHSADPLEAMHSARLSALLAAAADAMARSHFDPGHVTASAFVVHRDSRTILLHLHRRLGRWLQMGGHLDGGETPREAALREAREESGLRDLRLVTPAILDLDVHSIPAGRGEPAHLHFDVRFLVETSAPDRIAIRPDESRDLRWFGLDEAERAMGEAASSRALGKIAAVLGAGR